MASIVCACGDSACTFIEENVNYAGTPVSVWRCAWCADVFTTCPASSLAQHQNWRGCLAEICDSYDPGRDGDLYFGSDGVGAEE